MTLEKINKLIKIEGMMQTGIIFVETADIIMDDGIEISRATNRTSFIPGQDVSDQYPLVQATCGQFWTPELIANFQARQELKTSQSLTNEE
jgi:hypothetical protein